MKVHGAQADMLLWLETASVEQAVGPRWATDPTLLALVRLGLAVCEPTLHSGIYAANLNDAGRAEAARIAELRAQKGQRRGKRVVQVHYRGTRTHRVEEG